MSHALVAVVSSRRRAFLVAVALLLAFGGVASAQRSSALSATLPLVGRLTNVTHPTGAACPSARGSCAAAKITGTLTGDLFVITDSAEFGADGFLVSLSRTKITTGRGDITCSDKSVATVMGTQVSFADVCVITSGTGLYAGASGVLLYTGTFDLAVGLGEGTVGGGKIVLAL